MHIHRSRVLQDSFSANSPARLDSRFKNLLCEMYRQFRFRIELCVLNVVIPTGHIHSAEFSGKVALRLKNSDQLPTHHVLMRFGVKGHFVVDSYCSTSRLASFISRCTDTLGLSVWHDHRTHHCGQHGPPHCRYWCVDMPMGCGSTCLCCMRCSRSRFTMGIKGNVLCPKTPTRIRE